MKLKLFNLVYVYFSFVDIVCQLNIYDKLSVYFVN